MPIEARDIKGFLIECKEISKHEICTPNYELGFNEAIAQQGSVKLTLSRDKLAEFIYDSEFWATQWSEQSKEVRARFYMQADAIISRESELFEVYKGGL